MDDRTKPSATQLDQAVHVCDTKCFDGPRGSGIVIDVEEEGGVVRHHFVTRDARGKTVASVRHFTVRAKKP